MRLPILSSIILLFFILLHGGCFVKNPSQGHEIELCSTQPASAPNDFIGHSLRGPVKLDTFIMKKIRDNYNPKQGWNFLDRGKIAPIQTAINEYRTGPHEPHF